MHVYKQDLALNWYAIKYNERTNQPTNQPTKMIWIVLKWRNLKG